MIPKTKKQANLARIMKQNAKDVKDGKALPKTEREMMTEAGYSAGTIMGSKDKILASPVFDKPREFYKETLLTAKKNLDKRLKENKVKDSNLIKTIETVEKIVGSYEGRSISGDTQIKNLIQIKEMILSLNTQQVKKLKHEKPVIDNSNII